MRLWERAAPAFACLTPCDRALLHVLRDLHYLTCPQVHRACYPGLSLSSVRARLGELGRHKFLRWVRRKAFPDQRAFRGLAPLGRAAAGALNAADAAPVRRDDPSTPRAGAIAALHLDHLIETNDLFCALCEHARTRRLPPTLWLAGCRSVIDLDQTRLVPDAVVLAAAPDRGWWTYYLERDRGTMPPAAMRDKFERYTLLLKVACAQTDDPAWAARAGAWLLLACDDDRRAERLAALAVDSGIHRIWAGSAEACAAGLVASLDGAGAPTEWPPPPVWAAGALAIPLVDQLGEEDRR